MLESYYNAIIDTPEKAEHIFHQLLPGITLMALLVIAIIVLIVYVWLRCRRRASIILSIVSAIILFFDVSAICADYPILHYCLTGEEFVNKYGPVIGRSLDGDFVSFCLWWKPVMLKALIIVILAIILRKYKTTKPIKQ